MNTYKISKKEVSLSNDFNKLTIGSLSSIQLNILMFVAREIRISKSTDLNLPAIEIIESAHIKHDKTNLRLKTNIDEMRDKLTQSVGHYDENKLINDILFDIFFYDLQSSSLIIKVNEQYIHMFTEHSASFTKFKLNEFCKLKSKYSKNLYRLLMQYDKSNKWAIFKIDRLRHLLGCPDKYSNNEFLKEIVNRAIAELSNIMGEIRIEKKSLRQRGTPISTIKFIWFENNKSSDNIEGIINTQSKSLPESHPNMLAPVDENELPF